MDKVFSQSGELIGDVKQYIKTKADLIKVEVIDSGSSMITFIIALSIVVPVFFCFLIFTGMGLSLFLGESLKNRSLGYLFVGIIYLSAGLIVWLARNRLLRLRVINKMIEKLYSSNEKD